MPKLLAMLLLAATPLTSGGCFTLRAEGKNYVEPSIPRNKLVIRKVAILPNRLPISLQDPERWRRFNWGVIQNEFEQHNIGVVDYDTSVETFAKSGLPVEDTKSSRDKYADVAQQLGVDAVIVPYYGTFGSSDGGVIIRHAFVSVATMQIYLAAANDFISRVDATGTYAYKTGYSTALSIFGAIFSAGFSLGGGLGGVPELTYAGLGFGIAMPIIGVIIDAGNSKGTADEHWQMAFRAGIHEGLKPFFYALSEANGPGMQMTMDQTPSGQSPPPGQYPPAGQYPPPQQYPAQPQYPPPQPPPVAAPPINDPRARSCDMGQAKACYELGDDLLNGRDLPLDPRRAAEYFKRACAANVIKACVRLGAQYVSGNGVERNEQYAFSALKPACDANDDEGCALIAPLYDAGLGTARDEGKATEAYRKSCSAGRGTSCRLLGDRYRDGKGVAPDAAQAQQWYMVACALKAKAPGCDK